MPLLWDNRDEGDATRVGDEVHVVDVRWQGSMRHAGSSRMRVQMTRSTTLEMTDVTEMGRQLLGSYVSLFGLNMGIQWVCFHARGRHQVKMLTSITSRCRGHSCGVGWLAMQGTRTSRLRYGTAGTK